MKMIVCSVYDSASQLFGRPFFVHATGQAVRSFTQEVNRRDGDGELSKFPGDFDLFQIGVFDDSSAEYVPVRERLCRGIDVIGSVKG